MVGAYFEVSFLFPVIFTDGQTETGIGDVVVFPSTRFEDLQLTLSMKIGILPNQFSVFLTSRRRPDLIIPVYLKFDFSKICEQKDAVFLVALKRSRQSRMGRNQIQSHNQFLVRGKELAANFTMIRRDDAGRAGVLEWYKGLEKRVRDLQVQKERFLMSLGMADSRLKREWKGLVCEECEKARGTGRQVEFHHCINDAVTFGFRSPAGPVRPAKGQPL